MAPTPGTTISPPDWVTMVARHEPQRRCSIRPDESVVTYGEARNAINGLANSLNERGVTFGSRVALLGVDSPEYVIAVLATMRIGAVVIGRSPAPSPSTITGRSGGSSTTLPSQSNMRKTQLVARRLNSQSR